MSSLTFGHNLDSFNNASRRVYEVGVAGQSVIGALDHAVRTVSGEMSMCPLCVVAGASVIRASLLIISRGGAIGAGAAGVGVTWGCSGNWRGGPYVPEAKEGLGQAGRCKYRRTNFNNIGDRGYHPPSGSYRSIVVEIPKDLTLWG